MAKKGQSELNIFLSMSILILGSLATLSTSLGFAFNQRILIWTGAILFGIASLFITISEVFR